MELSDVSERAVRKFYFGKGFSEDRIWELKRGANSEKSEEKKEYRQDVPFQAVQRGFDERKVEFGLQPMRTLGLLDIEDQK